jgi:uncharacterized protein YjbI with pentapeptide repeats
VKITKAKLKRIIKEELDAEKQQIMRLLKEPDHINQGIELWRILFPDEPLPSLAGLDLQDANLSGLDLSGANLQGTNLRDASLQGANLQGANLRDAGLQGANLQNADLQNADLQGAMLKWAKLQGAKLQGANLQGAMLKWSHADANTIWPEGFDPKAAGVKFV